MNNPYSVTLANVHWSSGPDQQHTELAMLLTLLSESYNPNAPDAWQPDALGATGAARWVLDKFNSRFPSSPLLRKLNVELAGLAQQ